MPPPRSRPSTGAPAKLNAGGQPGARGESGSAQVPRHAATAPAGALGPRLQVVVRLPQQS
jgi:hypothetical protein